MRTLIALLLITAMARADVRTIAAVTTIAVNAIEAPAYWRKGKAAWKKIMHRHKRSAVNNPEQLASVTDPERYGRYLVRRNELLLEYGRIHAHDYQPTSEIEALKWRAWEDTK